MHKTSRNQGPRPGTSGRSDVGRPKTSGRSDLGRPRTSGRMDNLRSQPNQPFNGRRLGRGPDLGSTKSSKGGLPLTSRVLQNIIGENDANQLVVALSTKPGWKLLLESEFQLRELRVIFTALKKCCEASELDLLRRLMSETLNITKFETKCCLLLPLLGLEDRILAENVISILETSASLQPAGLARACMVILCSLESNRAIAAWNDASDQDLLAKIRTTREQLTIAAKSKSAIRAVSNSSKIYKGYRTSGAASNDFREMSILPTQEDLEEEHPFLRPNVVKGAYQSVDDYLDVQFRLLREDYVTPLRDGLREFKGLGADFCRRKLRAIQDVRFYMGVRFQRPRAENQNLALKERITLVLDREDFMHVNWLRSKRFTNGALIGISKDKFETIIFATVINRDPEALRRHGMLTLELCLDEELLEFKPELDFSLIESSGAYFEAYRHNLAVLQMMTDLPFSRHLVFAEKDVEPPSCLALIDMLDLGPILRTARGGRKYFSRTNWPQLEDTALNERQFDAVKSAFRNELCVIQGPPGTGKTFVGLKIVELMLLNEVTTKPFLIVCYTNHALDQFVEGISKFTRSIVRVGGRCDSEKLEQFTLRSLRRSNRVQARREGDYARANLESLTWRLRRDRDTLNEQMRCIEVFLGRLQGREIFNQCRALGPDLVKNLNLARIDRIVMPDEPEVDENELEDDGDLSDEDRGEVQDDEAPTPVKCNTRREAAISKLLGSHRQVQSSGGFDQFAYTKYKFERRALYMQARKESGARPVKNPPEIELEFHEWWQLYREEHWKEASRFAKDYIAVCRRSQVPYEHYVSSETLKRLKQPRIDDIELVIRCLSSRLVDIQRESLQNMKELNQAENLLDFEIIKNSKIIGVTTTGAAKFNALLRKVEYEIVVVEEAAEVLEAHLITTLCPSTKQMILIGDHQQLQPSTTVYKLATSFNLQISLFERLINNGISYVRLQEQHRMRDQFLKLLVPTIYSDYFSHESVFKYKDIKGLSHNLFFITHENSEESERENSSKSNLFEAEFVAHFSLYLRMQGYESSQIVILTTYSGQVFAIRNIIRDIEHQRHWTGMKTVIDPKGRKSRVPVIEGLPTSMFEGVRITTVDNYQGEESDIVIASFVRSNDDQKIGFLSKDNRVCVALSRAKKGFYCIGNIAMLANASRTWENISRVLLEGNCVNKGLELCCRIHDVRLLASTPADFNEFSDGGCLQPCGHRLNCGHTCPKTCHTLDGDHEQFQCARNCERLRPCGHPCAKRCHEDCGPCYVRVTKQLGCGHDAEAECHTPSESIACQIVVEKSLLRCAHTAKLKCCFPIKEHSCDQPCLRLMPCGVHRCEKKCFARCGNCMEFVDAQSPCGHTVRLQCRDSKNEVDLRRACNTKVEVQLPCGHSNMLPCQEEQAALPLADKCEQITEVTCSLGHSLEVKCPVVRSGRVDEHCKTQTPVTLDCGHQIDRPCNAVRDQDIAQLTTECVELVKATASCGHEVEVDCKTKMSSSSVVLRAECQALVEETLVCGHERTRRCNGKRGCDEAVTVKSPCGHEVVTLCSKSKDDEFSRRRCTAKCGKIIQCGHQCAGICCTNSGEEFHRKCLKKCKKTLFCGHQCPANCHSQCNPCLAKDKVSCPHGVKDVECLLSINEPCTEKPKHCTHVKCGAKTCADCYCSCNSRCQRPLDCQAKHNRKKNPRGGNHKCLGVCSERCVCSICDEKAINSAIVPKGVNRREASYIKLPCDHVFEKLWLDEYMAQHKDFLSFPRCPLPRCSAQIRFMRRYHDVLERIRLNMREVYGRVFGDLRKSKEAFHGLFNESVLKAKSPAMDRRRDQMTKFVDKLFRLSGTPSRFVLDYMRSLFRLVYEATPDISCYSQLLSELIASDELQIQLLSDYAVAFNRKLTAAPVTLPITPPRVDTWAACERNHVFSTKIRKRCPICPTEVDALAAALAERRLLGDSMADARNMSAVLLQKHRRF